MQFFILILMIKEVYFLLEYIIQTLIIRNKI